MELGMRTGHSWVSTGHGHRHREPMRLRRFGKWGGGMGTWRGVAQLQGGVISSNVSEICRVAFPDGDMFAR